MTFAPLFEGLTKVADRVIELLPDRCDMYEPQSPGTETRDEWQELAPADPTPVATDEPCLITQLSGTELLVARGVADVGDYLVTLKRATLLLATPRTKFVLKRHGTGLEETVYAQPGVDFLTLGKVLCKKPTQEVEA
ncbi:MAG: hypothetical protein WCB68_12515 [Pyrinomonadaceae bacterium]